MPEWVTAAFGEWYSTVYGHRDEAEAALLIATLAREVDLRGLRILDVACGTGRHLRYLLTAGASAVGVDLSPVLLAEARRTVGGARGVPSLVRGDMRALPFRESSFDGVTSLFTSFGYFSAAEDRAVLAGCARVMRPGGFLLLDFLNRDFVLAHHNPKSDRTAAGYRIVEERWLTAGERQAIKRVRIYSAGGGPREGEPREGESCEGESCVADYEERVHLYTGEELRVWLEECGLSPRREWGDYDGTPFASGQSPRHLFLSTKESS
jgi:SAM-dependent methyltransferase